jgi:predicted RNA binding protein YcfA (HicA-like mRNA interferase family)
MARRIHELKADLRRAGFEWRPGKGSHTIWTHPSLPGYRLTIAGNDDDLDGRCQEQTIHKVLARLRNAEPVKPQ